MACNKCGHTKSSPCACKDHGLTTPCSYTDCTGSFDSKRGHPEHCDEIICTTKEVTDRGNPKINIMI